MSPADNGRPRPGASTARGPMIGVLLLVMSMWTLSCLDASGKWVMDAGVPLLVLSWFRYAIHLVLVLTLVLPARGVGVLRSKKPREQLIRGGSMFLATLMFFTTLSYIPQAEATSINFLAPLLVLSLAPWILKEPARMSRFVAAGIAFVGVLIVIRPGGGLHPVGTIFGLLTACCFTAQFIATRRVAGDDPFTSLIWSGAVGTICLTIALPFILPPALPVLQALSTFDWLVLISTGITGCVGHLFQIAAYRRAPASTLAPFIYLQIISATSVGWLVWGHFPDPLTWMGIAIICASGVGIGMIEWRRGRALAALSARTAAGTTARR